MASIRDLFVTIGFDIDDRDLSALNRRIDGVKAGMNGLRNLLFGAGGVGAGLGFVVNEAGKFEQVEITFETLLKNAELAKETIDDLSKFIAKTPFEFKETINLAKIFIGTGVEADKLIPIFTTLGNIAAGVGKEKLPFLVRALIDVKNRTFLSGEETRQFVNASVPLLESLAEVLDTTVPNILKLREQGKITFDDVLKALERLSTGTGIFTNLMSRLTNTFLGVISNIKDELFFLTLAVGKELLPEAKKLSKEFLNFLSINKEILKTRIVSFIKDLVQVLKLATFAMLGFIGIQVIGGLGSIVLALIKLNAKLVTTSKLLLLNKAIMLALPFLIGLGITTLIAAITDLRGFFEGKKSITGLILDFFGKDFPQETEAAKEALKGINENFKDLQSFLGTIKDLVVGVFTFDKEKIKQSIEEIANEIKISATAFGMVIKDNLKFDITEAVKNINRLIDFLKGIALNVLRIDTEALKQDLEAVKKLFVDTFQDIKQSIKEALTPGPNLFQRSLKGTLETIEDIDKSIKENILFPAINKLIGTNLKVEDIPNQRQSINDISENVGIGLNSLTSALSELPSKFQDFKVSLKETLGVGPTLAAAPLSVPFLPLNRNQNITNQFGNISVTVPVTNNGNLDENKIADIAAEQTVSQINSMLRNANQSVKPSEE
jgi:tape measure domain-containing protein